MKLVYETPILISSTKAGDAKYWKGTILAEDKRYYRIATTWRTTQDGSPSKALVSEPYEITPKNIDRANATTAKEQALLEMEAIVTKQHDKGYHEEGVESDVLPLPMLANKYKDKKRNIVWSDGVYMQPKYNGMRMLYDGRMAWSRGGKPMIPEVIQHLLFDTHGYIVDGELILPDMPVLQETMKAAKKYREGISDKLVYVIFDIVAPDKTFSERLELYTTIVNDANNPNVIAAPVKQVYSEQEMMEAHVYYNKMKFEGSILRIDGMGYEIAHRSNQLLKFKDFQDGEFEIVNVIDGDGKFKGAAIFVCKTKDGIVFNCAPEGDMEYRKELYNNREQHINKWLTIRYQELTNDKVPQFPVGVSIRDKGDF